MPNLWFDNAILVDGMGRSGKSLVSTLLEAIQRLEPYSVEAYYDHICKLLELGIFQESEAVSLLRISLNEAAFAMCVGRRMNTRKADNSSIIWRHDFETLRKRSETTDYAPLTQKFIDEGKWAHFQTHEQILFLDIWRKAVPNLRIIECIRHPASLIASSWARGYATRWGEDPFMFVPCLANSENSQARPTFFMDREKLWLSLEGIDRVILLVDIQFDFLLQATRELSSVDLRFQLLEDVKQNPTQFLKSCAQWLNLEINTEVLPALLNRLSLPRPLSTVQEANALIKKEASPEGRKLFSTLIDKYNHIHNVIKTNSERRYIG